MHRHCFRSLQPLFCAVLADVAIVVGGLTTKGEWPGKAPCTTEQFHREVNQSCVNSTESMDKQITGLIVCHVTSDEIQMLLRWTMLPLTDCLPVLFGQHSDAIEKDLHCNPSRQGVGEPEYCSHIDDI